MCLPDDDPYWWKYAGDLLNTLQRSSVYRYRGSPNAVSEVRGNTMNQFKITATSFQIIPFSPVMNMSYTKYNSVLVFNSLHAMKASRWMQLQVHVSLNCALDEDGRNNMQF